MRNRGRDLEEETHRQNVENSKSTDQKWCECEVSVWTQDAIKNDWAGLSASKDLGREG